ncbi:MAG: hypothetical protein WC055_00210 [Melioribacteraceae bacterium]
MNELDFISKYCEDLTEIQMQMVEWHIGNGSFIGVGCAIGRSKCMPLISRSRNMKNLNIIDRCGYEQLASIENRRIYE